MTNFEKYLEDTFVNTGEFCGRGITKDDCEDLFCVWLEDLDPQEFINYAGEWMLDTKQKMKDDLKKVCIENKSFDVNLIKIEEVIN